MSRANRLAVVLAGLAALGGASVRAEADPVVARGVQYLRGRAPSQGVGESALIALALIKAEVPPGDPTVSGCIAKIRTRVTTNGYSPERSGGPNIYEAGVCILALANLDAESYRAEIQAIANYLVGEEKANGSWDYPHRQKGDTSISQYAVLGLWEAENAGANVPPEVWDRAAAWYLSTQASGGSWNYHRDEGGPETVSMTAAGVGSLLICKRQLARYGAKSEAPSPLLVPLIPEREARRYMSAVGKSKIDSAVKAGLAWIGANLNPGNTAVMGQSPYYGLYGVERITALAADRDQNGRGNWLDVGRQFIASTQQAPGGWHGAFGDEVNTVWAILFLTRSTAKTLRRIEVKRLGAGTLLGGRGLPRDLSSMTVAGGRVVSRPMNGAVEKMLAVLEDPRAADTADAALAGLVERYQTEGPGVLRPHKDRFRKLRLDRDPGLRRVAVWALGRTGDLDAAPDLIAALTDPDPDVVTTAREGLQLLSRQIEGLGPPPNATPEQRAEAARKWRAWYESIRPLDLEGQDDDDATATARSPR